MKVIKEGAWTVPWKQEVTCTDKHCGALLLAEESDVKAPDYQSVDIFKVVCPICGTDLYLPVKELPRRLKDELNKTRKYQTYSSGRD